MKTPVAVDLAEVARVLEHLLPHGYSLTHTRHRFYVKRWDSWIGPNGPRMAWLDVDDDKDLARLLARLGEHS